MRRNRQDLVDEIGDAHGVWPGTTRSDRPPDIGIAEGSQAYTGQPYAYQHRAVPRPYYSHGPYYRAPYYKPYYGYRSYYRYY